MDRGVLDTSTIIKSIFKPSKSLPSEIYRREMETHKKCRVLIKRIEERGVDVFIPRVCVIETGAVAKRLSNRDFAEKISKGVLDYYEVVDEAILFDSAWAIALNTGCSGFDSYFIAVTKIKNAVLFTDDEGMHFHAKEVGVDSVLMREINFKEIEDLF